LGGGKELDQGSPSFRIAVRIRVSLPDKKFHMLRAMASQKEMIPIMTMALICIPVSQRDVMRYGTKRPELAKLRWIGVIRRGCAEGDIANQTDL
jgi:hypothetical protein